MPRGGCVMIKRAIMKVKAAYFQKGRALMRNNESTLPGLIMCDVRWTESRHIGEGGGSGP